MEYVYMFITSHLFKFHMAIGYPGFRTDYCYYFYVVI
jgi:hypothetical protein